MLYRYAKLSQAPSTSGNLGVFTDSGQISGYAEETVRWAVGEGIITGKSGGRLDPKGGATRAKG